MREATESELLMGEEEAMDETMAEVRRIKEKCSLARLARTPEEQRRHSEEVIKRAEERLGRKIPVAGRPGPERGGQKKELPGPPTSVAFLN